MKNTIYIFGLFLISLGLNAAIDGSYETSCINYSKNSFFKSKVTIKEAQFEGKFYLYSDSNCQHIDLLIDYSSEVNYPTALEMGPMDHKVKTALMIVYDDKIKDHRNTNGSCGSTKVQLGAPINILGLPLCGPLKLPTEEAIAFDMYELKGLNITFGAFPLLWVQQEEKRPILPSRIRYRKK